MSEIPPDVEAEVVGGDDMAAGTTQPAFTIRLTHGGEPVDLSSVAAVEFTMGKRNVTLVEGAGRVGDDGEVRYEWADGDTDSPGTYRARITLTFYSGETLALPFGEPAIVNVRRTI